MIKWTAIILLTIAVTVMGYREIERYFGDSNTTLVDVRTAVAELRAENAGYAAQIDAAEAKLQQHRDAFQTLNARTLDLHQRVITLEGLAPAHPPADENVSLLN
jgi:hypothetical protein